jgi:hypothetical protein
MIVNDDWEVCKAVNCRGLLKCIIPLLPEGNKEYQENIINGRWHPGRESKGRPPKYEEDC